MRKHVTLVLLYKKVFTKRAKKVIALQISSFTTVFRLTSYEEKTSHDFLCEQKNLIQFIPLTLFPPSSAVNRLR